MLPNPGTTAENDEAGRSIPAVISGQVAGTVIGFSQGSATGLFNGQYGADGPGSPAWSLTITGGGATGLIDTATNTAITLVAGVNGVVLGKANGGAGAVVFAFSIDGSGNVTMVQYRAVNHGANEAAPGDHDEVDLHELRRARRDPEAHRLRRRRGQLHARHQRHRSRSTMTARMRPATTTP